MPKILNFIPLLIWSIALLFLFLLSEHQCKDDLYYDHKEKEAEAVVKIYAWGCVLWLILGIILSI